MFGREPERAQIEGLLAGVSAGPVGIALEGSPGIGKTTLWRDALASARRRGCHVLSSAPGEPDRDLAFAGLADLFDDLPPPVTAALPEPQRQALAIALAIDGGPPGGGAVDQQTLPRATLTALRAMAASSAVVLAIDDEQWLDRPSARVLAFALNRLREEPVCVLLSRRPDGDETSLWSQVAQRYAGTGLTTLRLAPLDVTSIGSMLAAELGDGLSGRALEQVHVTAGGNPLYALAIAREMQPRAGAAPQLAIPRTLTDAMSQRLGELDDARRGCPAGHRRGVRSDPGAPACGHPRLRAWPARRGARSPPHRDGWRPAAVHPSAPGLDALRAHARRSPPPAASRAGRRRPGPGGARPAPGARRRCPGPQRRGRHGGGGVRRRAPRRARGCGRPARARHPPDAVRRSGRTLVARRRGRRSPPRQRRLRPRAGTA